jgi:hypothetical protein
MSELDEPGSIRPSSRAAISVASQSDSKPEEEYIPVPKMLKTFMGAYFRKKARLSMNSSKNDTSAPQTSNALGEFSIPNSPPNEA